MSRRGLEYDIAHSATELDALNLISRTGESAGNAANGIRYESRGVLLVAGPAEPVLAAARNLAATLRVVALVDGPLAGADKSANVTLVPGRLAAVSGYLGSFRAEVAGGGRTTDLGPLSPNRDGLFDLILDLNSTPLLSREVPPLGYFGPGSDADALADMLARLPGLTGAFTKPKFFDYSPELCAHGRRGLTGCVRCLDACPAGAIETGGDKIRVEPHLCQGCGTCTAVCPTGAIGYAWPEPNAVAQRLRRELNASRPRRVVIFEDGSRRAGPGEIPSEFPEDVLAFGAPALAAVGMDRWFETLAAGVEQLLLWIPEVERRRVSMRSVVNQVECARAVLTGLGHESDRLRIVDGPWDVSSSGERVEGHPLPPGEGRGEGINKANQWTVPEPPHPNLLPEGDGTGSLPDLPARKREAIFAALDRLPGSSAGPDAIGLAPGAPFGQILVDPQRCTLCLSCAMVCPQDALHGDPGESEGAVPRLSFQESRCIQCGLCQTACPEDAIRLEPRFLPDLSLREEARIVAEGKLAQCVGCGAPIGSERMLVRLEDQLKDHPMFSGENLRRLRLCQRCKSVSA